jgi:hypothetical protein
MQVVSEKSTRGGAPQLTEIDVKCKYETLDDPCEKCKKAGRVCGANDKVFGSRHQGANTAESITPLAANAIERYETARRATGEELFGSYIDFNGGFNPPD